MARHVAKPLGTQHPNIAPYGDLFTTSDNKLVALAVGNNHQFSTLCSVLKMTVLDEFKDNHLRVANRKKLVDLLSPKIAQWKQKDLIDILLKLNVPIGGVYNMEEVFENPLAQSLVLEEMREGILSKRVKTTVFNIQSDLK